MFTDNPTIPAQLEVLLDVVHLMRQRKATSESLRQLIQPKGLPDLTSSSRQLPNHLSAATELELVREDDDGNIRLTYPVKGRHDAKAAVVNAFDRLALAGDSVEKWASRFYAYLVVRENDVIKSNDGEALSAQFMAELPPNVDRGNPMNLSKYRALIRWYLYVGLGWVDPAKAFVPDPTPRVRRVLPLILKGGLRLDADEFMRRLGHCCPELDGGLFFQEATSGRYDSSERRCTQALATALRRLHDEGILRLRCPADSKGWSLDRSGSSFATGEASNRFDAVESIARHRA